MKNLIHLPGPNRLALAVAAWLFLGCSSTAPVEQEPAPATTPAPEAEESAVAPMPAFTVPPMPSLEDVEAGRFINGKMWTFEYAPLEYFAETYGFQPDQEWFEKARLGALRIQGCSASFVSPHGLVLTNHHCARGSVTEVSEPDENLLDNGFYALGLSDERPSSQTADQLIEIVDVTDRVRAATATVPEAEMAQAAEAASSTIADSMTAARGGAEAGIMVEVIALWNGARYSAYVFRRYDDVRLVLAPELQIGFFGGDPDNFTYPRYNLDMSFYRIYGEDGEPLESNNHFTWSEDGVEQGDAVFVIGNPGGSSRLQTVSQLEFRRAVGDKTLLGFLDTRLPVLKAYLAADPEGAEEQDLRNTIFSLENTQKAYRGIWEGLFNPEYMAQLADAEADFRAALQADPELSAEYGGLFDRMADIQAQKIALGPQYGTTFALGSPNWTSATMLRALYAYLYLTRQAESFKTQLLAVETKHPVLERGMLEARLRDIQKYLSPEHEVTTQLLQGRTAEETAEALISHSVLADSARAADAVESGTLTLEDPAVQAMAQLFEPTRNVQATYGALNEDEEVIEQQLGQAHFGVYGTTMPPDATFSLRIADGRVEGYEYNGTVAPIHTTFYGLYDRYYSHGGPGTPWDLPAGWLAPPDAFDPATPLNFVTTADVIGGNSGSPVINDDLEVVGLIFDGNIESLPGDYIYDPEVNRSVAVDVRGILEALDDIYDADRIVLELTTGRMVATEAEADAVRR